MRTVTSGTDVCVLQLRVLLLHQLPLEGIDLATFPPCQYTLKMIIAMRIVSFEGALQPSVVPVGLKKLPKCDACRVGKGSATSCRFKGVSNYVFPNLCNLNDRTACKNLFRLNWIVNGTTCLASSSVCWLKSKWGGSRDREIGRAGLMTFDTSVFAGKMEQGSCARA
jgi:hypothetical protein